MCLNDKNYVQLGLCQHGSFHLRVGNTTLHLTEQQVLAIHAELKRCIKGADTPSDCPKEKAAKPSSRNFFGESMN